MKYFFLLPGWRVRRVWDIGGLWDTRVWRRRPMITKMGIYLVDGSQEMVLFKVEEAVQMLEVVPEESDARVPTEQNIGQVRITRLVSAEQILDRLTPLRPA